MESNAEFELIFSRDIIKTKHHHSIMTIHVADDVAKVEIFNFEENRRIARGWVNSKRKSSFPSWTDDFPYFVNFTVADNWQGFGLGKLIFYGATWYVFNQLKQPYMWWRATTDNHGYLTYYDLGAKWSPIDQEFVGYRPTALMYYKTSPADLFNWEEQISKIRPRMRRPRAYREQINFKDHLSNDLNEEKPD